MLINNKMKQAVGGNWGKPKGIEQPIKLRDIDLGPRHVPGKKKKRKKNKQRFVFKGSCCPFCHAELPFDEVLIAKKNKELEGKSCCVWREMYRVKICPKCASEIKECPACKRETWCRQGWYKHQFLGCGFEGRKVVK